MVLLERFLEPPNWPLERPGMNATRPSERTAPAAQRPGVRRTWLLCDCHLLPLLVSDRRGGLLRDLVLQRAGRLVRENGPTGPLASPQELLTYAGTHGLELQAAKPARYDWDVLASWCDNPVANEMWSAPSSTPGTCCSTRTGPTTRQSSSCTLISEHEALYDKLFRANNLPAMTPPGAEI